MMALHKVPHWLGIWLVVLSSIAGGRTVGSTAGSGAKFGGAVDHRWPIGRPLGPAAHLGH